MQPLADDDPAEIGGYRLQARLGAGGMGRVYLAATTAGRLVAVKVVRPELGDDGEFRTRFRQEILAAQRVHGLYTAQLVEADADATPPWLVTAYVPGPSLEEAVGTRGPMPPGLVLRLIAGVAEALQAIHAADVVHRDLKPSNVLLAQDGPRVIDFGIARALEAATLTRSDIMMGSPDYLAPEQILGLPVSPAIDVFALGSLAVYAAVGRPPFGHGPLPAIAHRVVHEPPDLEDCPPQLITLVEACLEKQPKARPTPDRIIDFCATRAAEMADASHSQPWPAWRPAGAEEQEQEQASAGKVREKKGHFRLAAALAATVLVAAPIAIAATLQLGTGGNTVGTAAVRRVSATRAAGTSAARDSASAAASPSVAVSSPARSHAPAPSHRPAAVSPAQSSSAASAPLVLLSQGHPVTASSVQGYPWAAANAVDGNLGTRWSSAWSDPQWLEVDLGATHVVREIMLYWENPAYATAFQLQISGNGTTWTDMYSTTTGTGGDQAIPVRGTGRYVRMYGTHRATGYGYSLWEFQVYGN